MAWVFREEQVMERGSFREERGKKGKKKAGHFGSDLLWILVRGAEAEVRESDFAMGER